MNSPRQIARQIWDAGLDAVRAERLVADNVRLTSNTLTICDVDYSLSNVGRICVVGAGKAAGDVGVAIESTLEPIATSTLLHGLINVPENCWRPTKHIRLHAARPSGVNEPRPEGVLGTQQIVQYVGKLRENDLCICVLTGGGSALLPAPRDGVTLADKINVTRLLSSRGASIHELNRVRIAMSDVKGGGLARACRAGRLVTLVISDVIGDPLDLIASGPTFFPTSKSKDIRLDESSFDSKSATSILQRYAKPNDVAENVWHTIALPRSHDVPAANDPARQTRSIHVLANNETAVASAAKRARELELNVEVIPPESAHTSAEDVAKSLVERLLTSREKTCLIWGGEPIVQLTNAKGRGKGGRNQQLILATLRDWGRLSIERRRATCVLSGGTDGEDGPTDAAGAFVDDETAAAVQQKELNVHEYLRRNDAYSLLDVVGALIRTGPTHTNVCDLRVAVVT